MVQSSKERKSMMRDHRSIRGRLIWGIVLLVAGGFALAVNLGYRIPRDMWDYWPAILIGLGAIQMAVPGSSRDRLGGFWLLVVGGYCWISNFELFGLNWGTSWPILIVAVGIRMVLGSLWRTRPSDAGPPSSGPNSGSTSP